MSDRNELARRREILGRHIGELIEMKREQVRELGSDLVLLIDVKRTRAIVEIPGAPMRRIEKGDRFGLPTVHVVPEQWTVPLEWFVLPGSLEPDPRQRPLFAKVEP